MNVGLSPSFFIYKYSKICRNLQIISVLNNVKMEFLRFGFSLPGESRRCGPPLGEATASFEEKIGLSDLSGKGV